MGDAGSIRIVVHAAASGWAAAISEPSSALIAVVIARPAIAMAVAPLGAAATLLLFMPAALLGAVPPLGLEALTLLHADALAFPRLPTAPLLGIAPLALFAPIVAPLALVALVVVPALHLVQCLAHDPRQVRRLCRCRCRRQNAPGDEQSSATKAPNPTRRPQPDHVQPFPALQRQQTPGSPAEVGAGTFAYRA
jgi:hypothetical protein